ncbi:MAG TPA: sugar transferase [Thermomicrobiales bacterium]|nr:sugar transferase [Thermomicrobiales bacterium]
MSRPISQALVIASVVLTDVVGVSLGFLMAYLVRFRSGFDIFYDHDVSPFRFYAPLVGLLIPLFLLIYACYQLYNPRRLFDGVREYAQVVSATTLAVMFIIALSFLVESRLVIARGWIVMSWITIIASVFVLRFMLRRGIYAVRRSGHLTQRVIVVGTGDDAARLIEHIRRSGSHGLEVVGAIDSDALETDARDQDRQSTLLQMIAATSAAGLVISATSVSQPVLARVVRDISQLPTELHIVPGIHEILTTGVQAGEVNGLPLITVNKVRITGFDLMLKHLLDYGASIVVLLMSLPVMLVVALAVRATSPGPVLHRRRVIGQQGRAFAALKFRTMYIDGDAILDRFPELREQLERHGKLDDDPRITPIGRLLRRWSLDELPQLFNVLRGQMSLVGPRMITESELIHFGQWRDNLSTVKPGLTGLWQVSGRSNLGYEDRVQMDMHYIRTYSIWSDLEILLRTIPTVWNGTGAR